VLPKGRTFLKYVKSKKKSKVENWAMEHLVDYFECSTKEVEDYLDILTKEQVTTIIMKYGVEDKQLKTIWSK
jgi:predicted phage-related endonuclease